MTLKLSSLQFIDLEARLGSNAPQLELLAFEARQRAYILCGISRSNSEAPEIGLFGSFFFDSAPAAKVTCPTKFVSTLQPFYLIKHVANS